MAYIGLNVDVESLAFDLANSGSDEDAFELITRIDELIMDYDFTVRLRDHFAEIIAKENEVIAKGN